VKQKVGISAITAYVPSYRVGLEDWCNWTNNSWDKISNIIGSGFRMLGPDESIYTMAANAVLDLIIENKIEPSQIGFLALGTESSTDNSAGTIIIKGMVNDELKNRGMNPISNQCEVPEFKQACLSGIYALKNAVRYVNSDAPEKKAIVVCSDIALYQIGSSGEPTQGAGAVATLIESDPKIAEVNTAFSGSSSEYRQIDFRKPIQYRAENLNGHSASDLDLPVFNGKYSASCYIDGTISALSNMSLNRGQSLSKLLNEAAAVFMHRPFHKMPMNAFSISYLYALANGNEDDHQEFYDLLAQADIQPEEIKKELKERPDLVTFLQTDINKELFPKTNKALKSLNRIKPFKDKVLSKIKLGNELTKEMGNIYSGSIFAWLAAGIEDSMKNGKTLNGKNGLLIGYGSGDAAEVIPISFTQDCCDKENNIKYSSAFNEPVNLNHKQYIKLRTNKILEGVESRKSKGFVVSKVGKEESTDFQDAGIEYYEYLN
jgi:hydroxymethylglutaryl-CoA synthase|tara:strand:- start:1229 stop:2695 length:1467 start_codon:yes stop_codon:yes gene_type:complete